MANGTSILKARYRKPGKTAIYTGKVCRTQLHKKKECDINYIMDKYAKTGILGNPYDMANARKPIFGDFSMEGDYHAMLNTITSANRAFLSLPPRLRQKFDNDPAKALEFVSKRENILEAVKEGILDKKALPKLVRDIVDPSKLIYVDKNGNKVDPVPGQPSLEEVNKKEATQ